MSFAPDAKRRACIRADLSLSQEAFVIGIVARLHPMKDHDTFLRAAALFARQRRDATFLLVGDGLYENNTAIVDRVRALGIADQVRLCGRRKDIAAIDATLDIATSSSWGEAFPNTIGEAMACGIPCVATDVGDVREIIDDCGFIVPPGDPVALCDAWEQLYQLGRAGRHVLGQKGRQRIMERYSLEAMSSLYAELYRALKNK